MGMFCVIIGLYCISQLIKTRILLLYMFIRSLLLNPISEIHWISKISTSNTNLSNSDEVSSILVRKCSFGTKIKIILRYI